MRYPISSDRIRDLPAGDRGLTAMELADRRRRFGPNAILEIPPGGVRQILRETAGDPMIWFLIGIGALFGAVGDYGEAAVLLAAIVPLIGMDAYLHWRTRASTQGLSGRLASRATVIRDGARTEVPATGLVPGDLVSMGAGELFPADGLIVEGRELQIDESALTGEAFPVRKQPFGRELPAAGLGVDARHWGFAGTRLLAGTAALRVVSTGAETLYAEIVRSALEGSRGQTPLQRSIFRLVMILVVAAVAACVTLGMVRLYQGHGWIDAVLSAVTLAVAAIPEEFPVVFTFFLGVGIFRLARRRALVRRAVAVENIGRASYLCVDKTGTLTEGCLRLVHLFPASGTSEPELLRFAALASRAEGSDPLDLAVLKAAGADHATAKRVALFPFTEDRRKETAIYRSDTGAALAVTKGAPEAILALCALDQAQADRWRAQVRELSVAAHKVIACAWCALDQDWRGGEPERGYAFAGLLAFEDPVRAGVQDAVRAAIEADIRVIMVTGDHPATATAVAREVGIGGGRPMVIEGEHLDERLKRDGPALLRRLDVVARAVPAQKLTLVRALQDAGEVVGVTGDGVNDVPALQAADIAIAMGERGTRSAREVGAIVLLDDNFRTIMDAIAEGRQLFRNLRLSFAYLLAVHFPLVVSAALIPLAGYPLLYLPIHIVWLELIIHPTAVLAFQLPAETERLARLPRTPTGFFSMREWALIGAIGVMVTAILIFSYDRALEPPGDVEHARAMALLVLIAASTATAAGLSGLRSWGARAVALAAAGSAVVLIQSAPIAALLHLRPLHFDDGMLALLSGLLAAAPAFAFRRVARAGRPDRPLAHEAGA